MQLIRPRIVFAVFALVLLGNAVDATITFVCDSSRESCYDALYLTYPNANCSGTAVATGVYPLRVGGSMNICYGLEVDGLSRLSTCGNGQYITTFWRSNTYCRDEPYSRSTIPTHVCSTNPAAGTSSMIICAPNDVDAPVTPPSTDIPNPDDPNSEHNELCPNCVCRPGFASGTRYPSRMCDGNATTYEMSFGALGVCRKYGHYNQRQKVVCHESFLRTTTYAGGCDSLVLSTSDIFRNLGKCIAIDPSGNGYSTGIDCPTVSPDPLTPSLSPTVAPEPLAPSLPPITCPVTPSLPPSLPGHASSISLSLVQAFIVLLIVASISL